MTINAAWQIKMEDKLGSITEGKYADLIILDQNPLDIDKNNLRNIKIIDTYVHGNKIILNPFKTIKNPAKSGVFYII